MQIRRYLSVLLTLLLLTSDSGLNVFAHTCGMSGRTVLSLQKAKASCGMKEQKSDSCSIQKKSCCRIAASFLKQPVGGHIRIAGKLNFTPVAFVANPIFEINAGTEPISPASLFPGILPLKDIQPLHQVFRC